MKTVRTLRTSLLLASSAVVVIALPVSAQTTSSASRAPATNQAAPAGSALTRNLNGGPATPSTSAATPATSAAPATAPARQTVPPPATNPAVTPRSTAPTYPAPVYPGSRPAATAPTATAPVTRAPVQPTTPAPTPVPATTTAPPPTMTVLTPTAVAALPFRVELPQGFRITSSRPGPDFNIYTIRRGDQSFAMIYVGPSSQFPIYDGEMVQTGGRSSIVLNQGGQRHAMEHLFQRTTSPREIHVWVSSLDGADALLAERIAQSVDAK